MVTCTDVPLRPSMRPVTWMSLPPVPGNIAVNAGHPSSVVSSIGPMGVFAVSRRSVEELGGRRSEHEPGVTFVAPRLPAGTDHDSAELPGCGSPTGGGLISGDGPQIRAAGPATMAGRESPEMRIALSTGIAYSKWRRTWNSAAWAPSPREGARNRRCRARPAQS